jgi:hypothetical protein
MSKTTKKLSMLGAGAVLAVASLAFAQGQGILFPDWSKPSQGTTAAPHDELGKATKAAQPWSVTTVASSIEGKTLAGQPVTVVGEVIDVSCYLQVGKHGDKHRDCAQKCARAGQPIGLLQDDGRIYLLIDEEHDPRRDGQTTLRSHLIEHMAHVVKVHGTYSQVSGQEAIYVQGFGGDAAKKADSPKKDQDSSQKGEDSPKKK